VVDGSPQISYGRQSSTQASPTFRKAKLLWRAAQIAS
jgi:hypothetical protein